MDQYNNFKKQLDNSLYQIEELEKRLSLLRKESASENYVQAQLNEYNSEILQLKEKTTTLQNNLAATINNVTTNTNEITSLKQSLTNNAVLEGIQADITDINSRLDTLETNVTTLTTKTNTNTSSINTLNSKYNSLSSKTSQVESKIVTLENKILTLETGMSGDETTNQNSYYSKVYNCFNFINISNSSKGYTALFYPFYFVSSKNCPLKIKVSADIEIEEAISVENSVYLILNNDGVKINETSFSENQTSLTIKGEFNLIPETNSSEISFNFYRAGDNCSNKAYLKNIKIELFGINVACINQDLSIKFTAGYDTYMCSKQSETGTLIQINNRQNFDYKDETKYTVMPSSSIYTGFDNAYENCNTGIGVLTHFYCPQTELYFNADNSYVFNYIASQRKYPYLLGSKCISKLNHKIKNTITSSTGYSIVDYVNCGFSTEKKVYNTLWYRSYDTDGIFYIFYLLNSTYSFGTNYRLYNNTYVKDKSQIACITTIDTINTNRCAKNRVSIFTYKNGDNYIFKNVEYLKPVYIGFGYNLHMEHQDGKFIVYKQVYDHVEKVTIPYDKFGEFSTPTFETITGMCEYVPLCKGDYLYKVKDNDDYTFVQGEGYEKTNDFIYKTFVLDQHEKQYVLQGYDGELTGEVTIPQTDPDGNLINKIAPMAFAHQSGITKVRIPNSITAIGSYCFYDCPSLTEIEFYGENTKNTKLAIGKCFIKNTAITDLTIPSHCNDISGILLNNSTIQNIEITEKTITNSMWILAPNLNSESYRTIIKSLAQGGVTKYLYVDKTLLTDEEKSSLSSINWQLNYLDPKSE